MWFTVLVLSQLTPQARYELTRTCTGHDLLLLLLPTVARCLTCSVYRMRILV